MRRSWRALGGALMVFALLSGAAGATGPTGLPNPKADNAAPVFPTGVSAARVHVWMARALSVRLEALTVVSAAVSASRYLTTADRAALDSVVAADDSGLAGLSAALAGDVSIPQLQTAADAMVLDYRVFSLLVPEVRAVIATDHELNKVVALTALEPSIQTAITTERQAGHRTGAAEKRYVKLVALLGGMETTLGNSSTAVLAVTPATYSSAPATLAASASELVTASTQLAAAHTDVHDIVKLLGAP